ncbi:hypothetical protein E4U19_007103 [Claviceps sp. Clav32 group G5]|nr:hypothetical protein E4U19_007103 [Claviceps sp. Clav32 group G5]
MPLVSLFVQMHNNLGGHLIRFEELSTFTASVTACQEVQQSYQEAEASETGHGFRLRRSPQRQFRVYEVVTLHVDSQMGNPPIRMKLAKAKAVFRFSVSAGVSPSVAAG